MQLYNKGIKANTQWRFNCQKKNMQHKEKILSGQTCQATGGYVIDSLKSHAQIFTLTWTNLQGDRSK